MAGSDAPALSFNSSWLVDEIRGPQLAPSWLVWRCSPNAAEAYDDASGVGAISSPPEKRMHLAGVEER